MKEKLKKIYNHFGEETQMHKLIEEAGEVLEARSICVLGKKTEHLILIGDH